MVAAGAPNLWKRLRDQGSFSLEKQRLWGDLSSALQYLQEGYQEDWATLFRGVWYKEETQSLHIKIDEFLA